MKIYGKILLYIVLAISIFYTQFYKLDDYVFRAWDETRLAISAYEMSKTGNLIVTTVHYEPDMWSTKPPLMIWAQALLIKLFGFSEITARFPAALSASVTIIALLFFVTSFTRNFYIGIGAAFVLCFSRGYLEYHGTRYGEYDAMLTLFTTLSLFYFFKATEAERPGKWLLYFFVFTALGVLTKSVAALLFLPALFLYSIFRGKLFLFLKTKQTYTGILVFILLVGGYYALRESMNEGYLKAVYENELGGRYASVLEGHEGLWHYYFDCLLEGRFVYGFWIVVASFFVLFLPAKKSLKRLLFFSLLTSSFFMFVISTAQTKLFWYDIPMYPLFAIIISLTLYIVAENVANLIAPQLKDSFFMAVIAPLLFLTGHDVYLMIKHQWDDFNESDYSASYYLRNAAREGRKFENVQCLTRNYNIQWTIYSTILNDKGSSIKFERNYEPDMEFKPASKLMAFDGYIKSDIEANYDYKVLDEYYSFKYYEIIKKK